MCEEFHLYLEALHKVKKQQTTRQENLLKKYACMLNLNFVISQLMGNSKTSQEFKVHTYLVIYVF